MPINPDWDCDFICFTDNPECVSKGWRIEIVHLDGESPAQANRRYKMLPHKYLPNYKFSLYVDGNIMIVADPSWLFDKYLGSAGIAIPKHPLRNCTYQEAQVCISEKLVNKREVEQQMLRYATQGFPEKFGLTANGIILRKHLDANVILLMDAWWNEFNRGGNRDQLSLAYLIWKNNFSFNFMSESVWNRNKYFRVTLHEKQKHITLAGRFVDYISCNRHRTYFHEAVYKVFQLMSSNQFLRRKLR
jgi:hypothetical protein